jgi:hypothetical protein
MSLNHIVTSYELTTFIFACDQLLTEKNQAVLVPGCPDGRLHAALHFTRAARVTRGEGVTSPIQKDPVAASYRRTDALPAPEGGHSETMQQKTRRDTTPDLLLKHPNAIVATYT